MFSFACFRWFAPMSNKAPMRKLSCTRRRYRPVLEALEDRLAPAVLTVNSAADNTTNVTVLTLRDALALVNNGGNPSSLGQSSMPSGWASQIAGTFGSNDTIDFAVARSGTQTIVLTSALPAITSPVTIDGTTEPGYAGQPLIVINASNSVASGLEIDAAGSSSQVAGLEIEGATSAGILLSGGGGNLVTGCWLIGNLDGLTAAASDNNTIGGTATADRNLISGNQGYGIGLVLDGSYPPDQNFGNGGTGNIVEGNWIGTDASGTGANGNQGDGVNITGSDNTIGGEEYGAANIIAFNGDAGVENIATMGAPAGGTRNLISANSIYQNFNGGIVPISLPIITASSASVSAGQVQMQATLTAAANTHYTVEFFGNPPGTNAGQGQDFLGATTATTGANGQASISFSAAMPAADHIVTATATDPNNNTSPFSVMQAGTAVLTVNSAADNTSDTTVLTLRDAITLMNNSGNPSSLGQSSMPPGWASQISGIFGNNNVIDFKIAGSGTQTIVLTFRPARGRVEGHDRRHQRTRLRRPAAHRD